MTKMVLNDLSKFRYEIDICCMCRIDLCLRSPLRPQALREELRQWQLRLEPLRRELQMKEQKLDERLSSQRRRKERLEERERGGWDSRQFLARFHSVFARFSRVSESEMDENPLK